MGVESLIHYELGQVPTTPCREYQGGRTGAGYGVTKLDGRFQTIHTWVVEQIEGKPLYHGEEVLHHCDNPPCFLYEHLLRGNKSMNREDARRKGRLHPLQCALDETKVREIRSLYGKVTGVELAKRYGVTVSAISKIQKRKNWEWVTDVAE